VRILCYHGFAIGDEHKFHPKLFIHPDTFRKRLFWLRAHGYPVLRLEEALAGLDGDPLPSCATVITIDDGFYSTCRIARPILAGFSFPATVYVASYYCLKPNPVFSLAVRYLFWRAPDRPDDLQDLRRALMPANTPCEPQDRAQLMDGLIRFGEEACDEDQRADLIRRLGALLGVDSAALWSSRALSLMDAQELLSMTEAGFDLQLHTHRHRTPRQEAEMRREITDNRAVLEPIVRKALRHFCYPSGDWSDALWPWLAASGIASATTCDPGFNDTNTPRFRLLRFLDGENISQIEFEAELTGFNQILRKISGIVRRRPAGES